MSTLFDLSALSADLRTEIQSSPKWVKFFSSKPKQLLGVDSNAKTVKGQAMGFYTAILVPIPGGHLRRKPMPNGKACGLRASLPSLSR